MTASRGMYLQVEQQVPVQGGMTIVQEPFKHCWKDECESSYNVVIVDTKLSGDQLSQVKMVVQVRNGVDSEVVEAFEMVPGLMMNETEPSTIQVSPCVNEKVVFQYLEQTMHAQVPGLFLLKFKALRSTRLGSDPNYQFKIQLVSTMTGELLGEVDTEFFHMRTKQKLCKKESRRLRCEKYYDYMDSISVCFLEGLHFDIMDPALTDEIEKQAPSSANRRKVTNITAGLTVFKVEDHSDFESTTPRSRSATMTTEISDCSSVCSVKREREEEEEYNAEKARPKRVRSDSEVHFQSYDSEFTEFDYYDLPNTTSSSSLIDDLQVDMFSLGLEVKQRPLPVDENEQLLDFIQGVLI